jgi:1-deoxy-D-xylulose-5-phosphate reductoisomerase
MSVADMTLPISYALNYPDRKPSPTASLDLAKTANLSFFEPDIESFECLGLR